MQVASKGEDWVSGVLGEWSVFPPTGHPRITHLGQMKDGKAIQRLVGDAVAAGGKGRAVPALSLGRSLWYWGSEAGLANSSPHYGVIAYDLLKRAYALLDRPALSLVLDAHFEHRALSGPDFLKG